MDRDTLVFIRSNGSAEFSSSPAEVISCVRDTRRCKVLFKKNLKQYTYSNQNIAICTKGMERIGSECVIMQKKDGVRLPIYGVLSVTDYHSDNPSFPDRVAIQFANGTIRYYACTELEIHHNPDAVRPRNVLQYLQKVSEALSACNATGDPQIDGYLMRQFAHLDETDVHMSAVRCLAHPSSTSNTVTTDPHTVVFPFGSNLSQMEAVRNALSNTLSIVEGPPGTGKTQTILNIIANLVMCGKSVLVVSPNNEATRNVVSKLKDEGFGFIVAPLGNRENRTAFIDEQPGYPAQFASWELSKNKRELLDHTIRNDVESTKELFSVQRDAAQAHSALDELRIERRLFDTRFPAIKELAHSAGITSRQLEEYRYRIASEAKARDRIGLFTKLRGRFGLGLGSWTDYSCKPIELELRINATLMNMREAELIAKLQKLDDASSNGSLVEIQRRVTASSKALFKAALFERYRLDACARNERTRFTADDLWQYPASVRAEYPVITSTTNAARGQLGKGSPLFDWVIIDESSQADLATGFLALSSATHAVVVGDTKQLPCVVTREAAEATDRLFATTELSPRYRYSKQSLLSCLEICVQEVGLNAPITLLREHYRCHPDIIGFCNQQFYGGQLVVMTQSDSSDSAVEILLTQDQNYDRGADYNHVQAELVSEIAVPQLRERFADSEIGIATPYRRQVTGMRQKQWGLSPIEVDTVHKYQGREKDAMVFVTCTNDTNEFLDDPNLVNVAISRAKKTFVLVASPQIMEGDGNLADFARYTLRRNGRLIQTDACSAFDLIYPNRAEELEAYLKGHSAQGDQYSEVVFSLALSKALKASGGCSRFGFVRNYPLKLFVPEAADLSPREREFVDSSAHADVLVYRKIDGRPTLVVEVNGTQHYEELQAGRDALKRSILQKCGIPYDAVLTNEAKHELERHVAALVSDLQRRDSSNRRASFVLNSLEAE